MSKNKSKTAFSLIEISIVILIIGILVAGVTQSSRLIRAIRLQTARSITTSSPVASIKNLTMWYETTLEKSIDEAERQDGIEVSKWYDVNPTSVTKNDATQVTSASRPKFTDNMINGLPALKFDGVADYLDYNGSVIAGTEYTIFVVEQRRTNNEAFIFGGSGGPSTTKDLLHIGYMSGGVNIRYGHHFDDSDCNSCVIAYSTPIPRIHIARFSLTEGKKYYINSSTPSMQNATQNTPLTSNNNAYIGRFVGYFNGDIGEIIIFSSALNTEELKSITDYLAKKWGIKVS